jgi:hypothetical protein
MRDEPRHRQFGWDVFDWLLLGAEASVVAQATAELPAVLATVEVAYGTPAEGQASSVLGPEVTAWGLADRADYARVLATCLERDVLPRFAARGVTVAEPRPSGDETVTGGGDAETSGALKGRDDEASNRDRGGGAEPAGGGLRKV